MQPVSELVHSKTNSFGKEHEISLLPVRWWLAFLLLLPVHADCSSVIVDGTFRFKHVEVLSPQDGMALASCHPPVVLQLPRTHCVSLGGAATCRNFVLRSCSSMEGFGVCDGCCCGFASGAFGLLTCTCDWFLTVPSASKASGFKAVVRSCKRPHGR